MGKTATKKIRTYFKGKKTILEVIKNNKVWIAFIVILIVGLYLRFFRIEEVVRFGWDQGRDAWIVREIILGKYTLIGPRTGIGHFHLGPLYFYLLVPFYLASNLDPMASNYLNFLLNIVNFVIIFVVTKKIFNSYAALFVILIYATNSYLIGINQSPWNVTLMPGIAVLIFYSIIKVHQGHYKWTFLLATLSGLYFHIHFTAIFIPFIILASLIFVKDKIKMLKYAVASLPLFLIWFVPNLIHELQNHNAQYFRIRDFLKDYYIGFHFRFLLHRLQDALIQFATILNFPSHPLVRFAVPTLFAVVWLNEKDKKKKLLGYLISLWFIIPLIGFTLYGGPLSEYYFLYNAPMVLFIIAYLLEKVIQLRFKPIIMILALYWISYIFYNTKDLWVKPEFGGLAAQKASVRQAIERGEHIHYTEGDIRSYLYVIWTDDNKEVNR